MTIPSLSRVNDKFYLVHGADDYYQAGADFHGGVPKRIIDKPEGYPALVCFHYPPKGQGEVIQATCMTIADLNRHITVSRHTITALLTNGINPFYTVNYTEKELVALHQVSPKRIKEIRAWEQLRGYCRFDSDSPASFLGDGRSLCDALRIRGDVSRVKAEVSENMEDVALLAKVQSAHLKTLEILPRLLTVEEVSSGDRENLAVELRKIADIIEEPTSLSCK